MVEMIRVIRQRDFPAFGELTMKDSNQFHATCLDTYPPIFYLNNVSHRIISLVHRYNQFYGETRVSTLQLNIQIFNLNLAKLANLDKSSDYFIIERAHDVNLVPCKHNFWFQADDETNVPFTLESWVKSAKQINAH